MSTYGLIVDRSTGIPVYNYGFKEVDFPTVIPDGCELVTFGEKTSNFALLYALAFEDPDQIASDYLLPAVGGIVYNFKTKAFSLHKQDFSINLDQLRAVRNSMLAQTDKYMMIPDLPDNIKQKVLAYRQALRAAPAKVGKEWKTIHDVAWPEFPQELIDVAPIIPDLAG